MLDLGLSSKTPVEEALEALKGDGVISGLANCHIPGVYSLVLKPRRSPEEGMLRIFYTTQGCKLDYLETDTDFTVMPHNHRQDVSLHLLFGRAANRRLYLKGGVQRVNEYIFGSALMDGSFSLKHNQLIKTARFVRDELHEEGISMKWSDVHTVVAAPLSAWVVKEGALAPEPYTSLCYSRQDNKQLDATGLYRKMMPEELKLVTDLLYVGRQGGSH